MYELNLTDSQARHSYNKTIVLWEMQNGDQENLFVNNVARILEKYQLSCPTKFMQNPPRKNIWRSIVKKAVNKHWYEKY